MGCVSMSCDPISEIFCANWPFCALWGIGLTARMNCGMAGKNWKASPSHCIGGVVGTIISLGYATSRTVVVVLVSCLRPSWHYSSITLYN